MILDDLGHAMATPPQPVRRVVSLVPSLTESLAVTDRSALVGATAWCSHPADLDVARVRGTKNPDLAAIRALRPEIVLANQEENRELDVRRLRDAGITVWVTVIRSVDEAFRSLRQLFTTALGWPVPRWLDRAQSRWAPAPSAAGPRVVIPVWRDPWMVVGSDTFTGDLAARVGWTNVYADHQERYPHVRLADITSRAPELAVLPDEPYAFSATDGPEAFPDIPSALVSGRLLTWYGPSLLDARQRLLSSVPNR